MLNRIIDALGKENVSVWQINSTLTDRAELYFIRKKLDMPRLARIQEYEVSVYNDFELEGRKMRGVSSCFIEEGQTDEEIRTKIRNAYFAAGFVRNPFFELPDAVNEPKKPSNSDLAGMDICEISRQFADAVLSLPTDENAFVNSLEIFVLRKEKTIVASNGLHVSYSEDEVSGEFVTQCKSPVDVEQYRQFAYNSFDIQSLRTAVMQAIGDARMRAMAKEAPKKGTYDILITGENIKTFFYYYLARSNASVIFPGYSTWKIGDTVQSSENCEKLDIDLVATSPYSNDGIPMEDRPLLKKGVLSTVFGPTRFMRYLGQPLTGNYAKYRVNNAGMHFADMKKEGTLETISFSDFQMNFMSGNFGGELRLGTIRVNGEDVPVSGGSVNGKLSDVQDKLIFSIERYEDNEYSGPYAVLIPNVPVAGQ